MAYDHYNKPPQSFWLCSNKLALGGLDHCEQNSAVCLKPTCLWNVQDEHLVSPKMESSMLIFHIENIEKTSRNITWEQIAIYNSLASLCFGGTLQRFAGYVAKPLVTWHPELPTLCALGGLYLQQEHRKPPRCRWLYMCEVVKYIQLYISIGLPFTLYVLPLLLWTLHISNISYHVIKCCICIFATLPSGPKSHTVWSVCSNYIHIQSCLVFTTPPPQKKTQILCSPVHLS